jgi:hypothetical protein
MILSNKLATNEILLLCLCFSCTKVILPFSFQLPHQPITAVLRHRWTVDALLLSLFKAAAQSRKTL